jgi:hypothetical protein
VLVVDGPIIVVQFVIVPERVLEAVAGNTEGKSLENIMLCCWWIADVEPRCGASSLTRRTLIGMIWVLATFGSFGLTCGQPGWANTAARKRDVS